MLSNYDDVVRMAGALLDDPSNSWATSDYMRPHVDLCYAQLDVQLQQAGLQYIESLVVLPITAGTVDLADLMEPDQPLADMKSPKWLCWWLTTDRPSQYRSSAPVLELSNPDNCVGVPEWRNANGSIQINASVVDVQLQVAYDRMSTTMYDPYQNVVRGTAHILAHRVAAKVAGLRKGMEVRKKDLQDESNDLWSTFKAVLSKARQGISIAPRPLHGTRRSASIVIPAPADDIYQ